MNEFVNNIFVKNSENFRLKAFSAYQYQKNAVPIYKNWVEQLGKMNATVNNILDIPFLPISFFKSHSILSDKKKEQIVFESSGTTTSINSKHLVGDLNVYKKSFETGFDFFYGNVSQYCIIGLLPSYLERNNSSLVFMIEELIKKSKHENSGFYLNDFEKLAAVIKENEENKIKTIIIGVTFALLNFAEQFSFPLQYTILMETGGMKGRREEMTRAEVHAVLIKSFHLENIHSEYGMTELLSQAYSKGNGIFYCPPWMKVLVRSADDPFQISETGKGCLNIIDLANYYSCSFIATDDVGIVYKDGSFEVQGRLDNSDVRGCNLLVV